MNKYIDADLLREKITEQMKSLPREVGRGAGTITAKGYGMMEAFQIVRSIIDSLQQEQQEVDLEKEVRTYCSSSFKFNYDEFNDSFYSHAFEFDDVVELARHFYELGFNTRKEK